MGKCPLEEWRFFLYGTIADNESDSQLLHSLVASRETQSDGSAETHQRPADTQHKAKAKAVQSPVWMDERQWRECAGLGELQVFKGIADPKDPHAFHQASAGELALGK